MSACIICLGTFKFPAALPCGHVFCYECIRGLVSSAQPFSTNHPCPTCRRPFSTLIADPILVPEHLKPFISPSIRLLYVETSRPIPTPTSSPVPSSSTTQLPTNVHAQPPPLPLPPVPAPAPVPASEEPFLSQMRTHAQMQASSTLCLAALTRVARDQAVRMREERDHMEKKYHTLKVKYSVLKRQLADVQSDCPPKEKPIKREHSEDQLSDNSDGRSWKNIRL